jgi:hypothetical protein
MKKITIFVFFVLIMTWQVLAQDAPKAELYGGYALLHETDMTMHGFQAGIEGKISNNLGIVGEFGMVTKSVSEMGVDVSVKAYPFLFGPRFSARVDKTRIFAEVLVGGLRFSGGTELEGLSVSVGTTAFSYALGGGIDYSLNNAISIRPVQLDLIRSRASMLGETIWGNDLRYSAGLVLKFGGKK